MKDGFYGFLQELKEEEIPLHSAVLLDMEGVLEEAYLGVHHKDELHRMFSVSKSLVSLAIGCLCEEGRIGLDVPILAYFQEYAPRERRPRLERLTVRDMLKMQTCHNQTTYKKNRDAPWLPSFFTVEPHHEPGMMFCYDTSSSQTLCALAERISGKDILSYLRERCLNEIGFSEEAYFICNSFGEPMGGSGLMAKTGDLAKLALLLLNGGSWKGRQLLPKKYLEAATSLQTPTIMRGDILEERQGYGYQFWRLTHNGFGCYGMGGQLVLCYPEYKRALVTTADTMGLKGGNQAIYNSLYRNILDPMGIQSKGEPDKTVQPGPQVRWNTRYRCLESDCWTELELKEDALCFYQGRQEFRLRLGLEKPVRGTFPVYGDECLCSARWLDERSLYLSAELLGENMASFEMQAVFSGEHLLCLMKNTQEYSYQEFGGWLEAVLEIERSAG